MNKSTFSQVSQTKDQGPDPTQFLCNEQIVFFSNLADQRQRTRSNSVPMQPTNQLLLKCCRPKTKDQIQFSSFAINKSTSSQMWQTKEQGPDPIELLCNEQIDFFSNVADQRPYQGPDPIQFLCNKQINFFSNLTDQRPRTRSNWVPLQWIHCLLLKSSRPKTKDQIQFSSYAANKSTPS
jgi:hypothetical protein